MQLAPVGRFNHNDVLCASEGELIFNVIHFNSFANKYIS